jgi:Transposase DDE domain group 1
MSSARSARTGPLRGHLRGIDPDGTGSTALRSMVEILIRGDSHYSRPEALSWLERHRVGYIFGLAGNKLLLAQFAGLAEDAAMARIAGEAVKTRRYGELRYAAKTWDVERKVIARIEASTQGADSRFIVTNLPGAPRWLYDVVYCARGQAENPMYGRLPLRKRCLRRSGTMRSAAVMYPASHAATWLQASMRSAAGSRLSSRARSSVVLSGSADPGPTGHAIVSKITLAARGNCGRLLPGGQTRTGRSSRPSSCPFNATTDHAGAR